MSPKELIEKIEQAPEEIQKQLLDYLETLLKNQKTEQPLSEQTKVRKFGSGKGIFTHIPDAEEFNKPLEDFKDYM